MRNDGAEGPEFGMVRINLPDVFQFYSGIGVGFGIDQMIDQQQQRWDVPRVEFEDALERFDHLRAIVRGEGAGQTEMNIRIVRVFLYGLIEIFGGNGEILFFERQFAGGQIRITQFWIRFLGGFEKIIEDELWIGAQQDGGIAERHDFFGLAI